MKPANFCKMLQSQAEVVEIGDRSVGAQLRQLAGYFGSLRSASVAAALKGVPTGTTSPRELANLLRVLDATIETHRAVSAKSAAIADLKLLKSALGSGPGRLSDIIAVWETPKSATGAARTARPKAPAKSQPVSSRLVDEYVSALRDARYEAALAHIDRLIADKRLKLPDLRAILAAVHKRTAPSKATKSNLIDAIRRPFIDDKIDVDKSRAIRSGGAL